MIDVHIKPRADGKYDIYVTNNGEPILNSSQGYANAVDAERIVTKLFGSEPVNLVIDYRNGARLNRSIRAED